MLPRTASRLPATDRQSTLQSNRVPEAHSPKYQRLPDIGGRHPNPGLLERRFPGVFRTLQDLRPIETSVPAQTGRHLFRAFANGWARRVRVWRERSQTRFALARMSEVELHDLGLSRSQIFAELNKPFWKA